MKRFVAFLTLIFVCSSAAAGATEFAQKETIWAQTQSTHGDCPNCELKVVKLTPHLLGIESNNGWYGVGYYDAGSGTYRMHMEWLEGKGGAYEGVLFTVTLKIETDGTLSFAADSAKVTMKGKYKPKT